MTEERAKQAVGPGQLGARARTILKSLAENGPAALSRIGDRRSGQQLPEARPGPREVARTENQEVAAANADANAAGLPEKVVPLPRRLPARKAPAKNAPTSSPLAIRPVGSRKKKTSLVKISALLAIALPTVMASIYYLVIASDQYVAEARFAVRGSEDAPVQGDTMGSLTGLNSVAATSADSFILSQFMESRELVDNLQRSLDLRKIFTNENADFLAKYRPLDTRDTAEHLNRFWNTVASVYYEPISGIITFTVRAFTPEDALAIARGAVLESERLVNRLSDRARGDAVLNAKTELSRAEMRLKFARRAVRDYRDREGSVDPTKTADSRLKIVGDLESELSKQEAEYATSLTFLNKDAPTMRVMRNKIAAMTAQISTEKAKLGNTERKVAERAGPLLSTSLAEYEELDTDREFAQKTYEGALTAVEHANLRAERQSRYLATFVEPRLPESALYPRRIQMILLVLVCSALAWAIGILVYYGIRDHTA
jgi:capsular polysaccharide transport system permease protein